MQYRLMGMVLGVAILFGIALSPNAVAQQANPAAQLNAVLGQKAQLEAQQQADRAEIERYRAALENLPARIQALTAQENLLAAAATNPALVMGQAWAQGKSPAVVAGEALTRNVDVRNSLNTLRALQTALPMQIAELTAATTQRGNQIAQLDGQIEQLERTIAYNRNPLQGDLANEQARLKNLEGQKATQDDGGQLGWDIENTRRRIKELQALEQQFQQGGGSQSGASSGQTQGPYGAGAGTSGTGSQSPGVGPYLGAGGFVPGGSSRPTHQQLQEGLRTRGGTSAGSSGGSHTGSSTGSSTAGTRPPATGPSVAGSEPVAPPPSGATCGSGGPSCTCPGGNRGHIPCDEDKKRVTPCHC